MTSGPEVLSSGEGIITAEYWIPPRSLRDPRSLPIRSVVFVHGLRGDRIKSWSRDDVCWPRDLLAEDLKQARIITYGYDADVTHAFKQSSHASIFGIGQSFLRDISRLRRSAEEVSRRTPRPRHLSHCLMLYRLKDILYSSDIVWAGFSSRQSVQVYSSWC